MAVAHMRAELQGRLATNRDIWSCSFSTPAAADQADLDDRAAMIGSAWHDNVWTTTDMASYFSSSTSWTAVKCSNISSAGVVQKVSTYTTGLPLNGVSGSDSLPPECSCVISLLTATAGGRYRGRMYLPPFTTAVTDIDGALDSSHRTGVADAMEGFFNEVNAGLVLGFVDVYSQSGGFLTPVTAIRVGNIIDTQRRRRNRIPEVYDTRILA